jgi:uncharacterized repeat protein (TIGR03847 family)
VNKRTLNIGTVQELAAESFGEPGQRTFRLKAATPSGQIGLWLEKQQLVMLGAAIEQILEQVPSELGEHPHPTAPTTTISGEVEAHVGSMALAYDREQEGFILAAQDLWDATLDISSVVLLVSHSQLALVEKQVEAIVAASRPRCLLCDTPLSGEPHFCPPSNGHARVHT